MNRDEYIKKWRSENPDRVSLYKKNWEKRNPLYKKQYAEEHKEEINLRAKRHYEKNRESIALKKKIYDSLPSVRIARRKYINKYVKEKWKTDIQFRLSRLLRTRINTVLKENKKLGSGVKDLGCTLLELKTYLESKFVKGMSWDNKGEWHIDHINPLSSFNLLDKDDFRRACHYTNLQPMWATDNLHKSNKKP